MKDYSREHITLRPFFAFSSDPSVNKFVKGYEKRFGSSPDLLSAQAYDAADLALTAFGQASSGQNLSQTLQGLQSTMGVTGYLSTRGNGDIARRMSVIRVDEGEVVEVLRGGKQGSFTGNSSTSAQGIDDNV